MTQSLSRIAPPPAADAAARRDRAGRIIAQHLVASAGVGLLPGALVWGFGGGLAIDVAMLARLARLYDASTPPLHGRNLLAALSSGIGASLATAGLMGLGRLVPGFGGVFARLGAPVSMAAFCYALGWVFVRHLDGGGRADDFNPADDVAVLREMYRRGQDIVRLRAPVVSSGLH